MNQALCAPLLTWFQQNQRDLPWRRDRDAYHVWLSEIMLQQTRVQAVIPYYERFLNICPTVRDLAALDEDRLLKLWEGLGYYSRARNLHRTARIICQEYGGTFPADYTALRALPGVGDYTAGAIGSIAFDLPVPAVDGNVLRVVSRLTADNRPIDEPKVKRALTETVRDLLPVSHSGDFNQALMELGATICPPSGTPRCGVCPVANLCEGYTQGIAATLPMKKAKKSRRIEARTVLLLRAAGKIGLRRRPKQGLLAGLWELPAYEGTLSPDAVRQRLADDGFSVAELLSLRPAKHIFTHVEWHMTGYEATLTALGNALTWVTPEQLRGAYALPSAFRPFLREWEDENGI